MATSRQQVKEWYDEGKKEGHKFMTVICDTFDWSDFPSYGSSPKSAGEMEKIMEVFDLSKPFPPNLSGVIYKSMETKQQQKDQAGVEYRSIKHQSWEEYEEMEAPLFRKHLAREAIALKDYQTKCEEIDKQDESMAGMECWQCQEHLKKCAKCREENNK